MSRVVTVAAVLASAPVLAGSVPGDTSGRSYFFATREACSASGVFSRQECATAFANAHAELRDRAPRFAAVTECRLRFALCEPSRDGRGYAPVGLGVEMIWSERGARAAPAMAVETPRSLFPTVPVDRDYVSREAAQRPGNEEDGAILRADRFQPFAKRPRITAQFSFNYESLGQIEGAQPSVPQESVQERRARLRAAPFVE